MEARESCTRDLPLIQHRRARPLRLPDHDVHERGSVSAFPRKRELDPVDDLEAEARVQRGGTRQRGEEALDAFGVRDIQPVADRGSADATAVIRRVRA